MRVEKFKYKNKWNITLCSTDADTGIIDTVVSIYAIAKIFFITVIIHKKFINKTILNSHKK